MYSLNTDSLGRFNVRINPAHNPEIYIMGACGMNGYMRFDVKHPRDGSIICLELCRAENLAVYRHMGNDSFASKSTTAWAMMILLLNLQSQGQCNLIGWNKAREER